MGDYTELSRARVVDFTAYKTARAQQLSLLEEPSLASDGPVPEFQARSLDARQIEHRERMLTHLGARRTCLPRAMSTGEVRLT